MASARVRQAFRDDDSDEEPPQQTALHRSSRHRLDSSGDEGSARQAPLQQRRPLSSVGARVKHTGHLRPEETGGDLRPTTPPAGPSPRNRQADWASAVLQMLQNGALVAGQPVPSLDALQRQATGSVSSKTSRRPASTAPASSHHRAGTGSGSSASTKVAAARTLDNLSSDDDEAASVGMASASLQAAVSGGSFDLKPQGQPATEVRGARSSRLTGIGPGATADATNAPSSRLTSSTGRAPAGGSSGGFAAAAAAAFEGLPVSAHGAAHRQQQQQRAGRVRRISGNVSVASDISHQESLASSRQTLGSSRLSATVQRVVARQRLLDSSSGEEDGDASQRGQQLDSDVGQAGRLLARFKSLSSSASATSPSGLAPTGTPPSPGGSVLASGRKSPTAAVAMIPAAAKSKSSATAGARPPSASGYARPRPQPADAPAGEAGAFTFNAAQGSGGIVSDGISPRMRQATAAAVAEVSAAAASSLRPLPLTSVVAARLTSPVRPPTAPQPAQREPHRAGSSSLASTDDAGGFAAAGGAAAARQALAGHVSSSHRIATWLEQQPTLSSVGIADDIVSECATTVTGTEIDLDHGPIAGVKASARFAERAMESIMSGDLEMPASGAGGDPKAAAAPRSRAVRLSISSDEDEKGGEGLGRNAYAGDPAASMSGPREPFKKVPAEAGDAVKNQLAGGEGPRPSSGAAAKGAQAAPESAATTAARRLEFAGRPNAPAVSPRLVKELTSNFSSPSFRAVGAQSPNGASASPPSDRHETTVADKATTPRASGPAAAASTGKPRLTASGVSPRRQHPEADSVERQTAESSSPDSAVRIASIGGQHTKASPLAAGGRLTPNELRVMLSVLSRPAWGSGAGGTLHAVASALSPQPSHSGDSVQSFSYSEMLQVMRAMSSSGGGGSPSSGSGNGGSAREGARAGRPHKSSGKDGAHAAAVAALVGAAPCTAKQQLHDLRHQLPRSARDPPAAHTSLEVKGPHSARSFDGSSGSLGEHPMAAPLERDWSASASTVSGHRYSREEQQQRDFADMVRLWNLLTGRHLSPESLEVMGLQTTGDGIATPRSGRTGPGSVLSGAGGSGVLPPSAAVLAASAAAMATSAVMAAAGGANHQHCNAYIQGAHLHPFPEAHVAAATAASQFSQEQQQPGVSPAAAAGKTRFAPAATSVSPSRSAAPAATHASSPRDAPQQAQSPLQPTQWDGHDGATDPVSIQSDLMRLMRLLTAAGQAELVPSEASEATKGDLGRLVQLLRAGVEAGVEPQAHDGGSPLRQRPAPASTAVKASASHSLPKPLLRPAPGPTSVAAPAAAATRAPIVSYVAVEGSDVRPPSSRRSSSDTVETGLALGRLYQSLRNLRVRDEGDQTEGGEMRPIAETTSGCAQTDSADLQQPSAVLTASEDSSAGERAQEDVSRSSVKAALEAPGAGTLQGPPNMPGCVHAPALPPLALSGLVGKDIRVTRALKLPNGQLVELDSLLALASEEATLGETVDGSTGKWLQDLRALNTASTTPTWCPSPSTTDGGVQTDLTAHDLAAVLLPAPLPQQLQAVDRRLLSDGTAHSDAAPSLGTDSAAEAGTSVTVAPAIRPGGSGTAFGLPAPAAGHLTVESAAAVFPLRNLPIASEGGIMDAPNQEAVTAGRVGSAGGMLAYLEAADPTTATALLELVQALQLMTLHSRRRRWISDGSSSASGTYLVDPRGPDSLGGSSAVATTLRYSFGTSIGPSVSQAGQASFIDMPDAEAPALAPAVKAATTGGLEAGAGRAAPAAGEEAHTKRQTHNAGLPPRPVPADSDPTSKHLRRALRAVSGGGTVRLTPTRTREAIRGGAPTSTNGASAGGVVSSGAVAEAAKVHIARALELLSQSQVPNANAPAMAVAAADVELLAQEELVAALLALLAPGSSTLPVADNANVKAYGDEAVPTAAALASQNQPQEAQITRAERSPELHRAAAASGSMPQQQPVAATSATPTAAELSPSRPVQQSDAVAKPTSPLHARIQEVLQQAERASAGISSLQVGLSPTAPAAAEVLDGVPFEQAIGFIMDGLRDFDSGPSQLARHLHLMYAPSSGGVFYPTALESLVSRRQSMVALGAAAVLEAAAGSDAPGSAPAAAASEVGSEEPQPLTDAERERVQALVSEAVAAAEALARGARREEEWNAERLGLPLEDEGEDGPHAQAHQSLCPVAPSPALAGADSDSSPSSSLRCSHIRPISAGSAGTTAKPRFASAGSAASVAASGQLQPSQTSPPGSLSAAATTAAMVSPGRLIAQVTELGADAMASLLPGTDLSVWPSAGSAQRSAPVTIAGMPPFSDGGDVSIVAGHLGAAQTAPFAAPQTFGGAMDLPEDSALGPAVSHSVPWLPYGDLDEQLLPIQPGAAGVLPQGPLTGEMLLDVRPDLPLMQPPAPALPATTSSTRLPTFATPSAPAVRGAPSCSQPPTNGGISMAAAAIPDPRLASTYGGTMESRSASVAAANAPALEHLPPHEGPAQDGEETSDGGWESDMADAARICSPEAHPSEVASFAAVLPQPAQSQRQLADCVAAGPSNDCTSPAAAAMSPKPSPRPQHVAGGMDQVSSAAGPDPEVPALTAMDRFKSPRPFDASPYKSESPMPLTLGIHSSSSTVTRGADLASAETSTGASLEVQPQQSSAWSLGSEGDAKGGFASVRLARDAMSGSRISRFAEGEDSVNELPAPAPAVHAAAGDGECRDSVEAEAAEEVRARRALFAAPAPGGLEQASLGEDERAEALPAAQTEQLLTQAAQLLFQAMQRTTEGQPEQEAAFRILAPILQGLATATQSEQLRSFGSVDEQQHESSEDGPGTSSASMGRGSSFTFGEVTAEQPQEQQHLATAADLESFKEDVMTGVRSALMEIVDMIGSAVMHRPTPGGQHSPAQRMAAPGGEVGWETGAGLDPNLTPERSSSPYLAPEPGSGQQEIRITRAELEAFMFGKAVLSSTAADDLLSVRLRELYAPQLPKQQDDDDELVGGYEAVSIASNDPRALRDRGSGSLSSIATAAPADGLRSSAPPTAGSSFNERQRRPYHRAVSPEAATPGKLQHGRLDVAYAAEPDTGSPTAVPRDSPLRQPLADAADFKSLFRRSIEHLRGHLQPAQVDAQRGPAAAGTSAPFSVPAALPRAPRQPAFAATVGAASDQTVPVFAFEATLSPAGVPPPLVKQMAAAAAMAAVTAAPKDMAAAARRPPSTDYDDDVELDPRLSGGRLPEPSIDLARLPDPNAPAAQLPARPQPQPRSQLRSQSQSRRGTADSNPEAIGDFLAALAEPMMQVVGVLAQQPGGGSSSSSNRPYPRRSVVIEELADEQPPQLRSERPSRVPGFAATNSASHVVLDEDEDEEELYGRTSRGTAAGGTGIAHLTSPGVASEGSMSSLRLRHPAAGPPAAGQPLLPQHQHVHLARSASSTPVPRAIVPQYSAPISLNDQQVPPPAAAAAEAPVPLVPVQYPQTQLHHAQTLPVGGSRLKMSSMPGTAAEDRPLSSFLSPSEGGAAASPPRRRTHSPGPLSRQAGLRAEPLAATIASVSGVQTCRSVDMAPSPPGTSLDELEGFLRAFRTRIGTDETGDGPLGAPMATATAVPQLAVQHAMRFCTPGAAGADATPGRDPFRRHVLSDFVAGPLAEAEDVRHDSNLSESVSVNTARRVITGFNVHTIRASGASALAAAAAVEQAFSPRTERAIELAAAAATAAAAAAAATGGSAPHSAASAQLEQLPVRGEPNATVRTSTDDTSGVSDPTDASRSSSYATPTNPLLREHLEHFQTLLEKANDLVDRLMLADEDLTSEGGAAEPTATLSPRTVTPQSGGNAARRHLTYRLTPQRSGSAAATPVRQATTTPLSALAPCTPADIDADAALATPPPVTSLDPELAALFPATAARLARPHARLAQSPDAANSLLSSAVTAVPQLAVGADRVRSLSSTPANQSPAASTTGLRLMATQSSSDLAPAAVATAGTPLALVAALLAEAHSRMEFRSLDEQRGADRILSAVLDEHFAHVLGTPRGFLTPARGPTACTAAATSAAGAEAATPPHQQQMSQTPQESRQHRVSTAGPANLSGAFSHAFATAAEAKGAEFAPEQPANFPVAAESLSPKQATEVGALPGEASTPGNARPTASGTQQQRRQSPSAKMQEEMCNFLAQVMQQRSDILSSALDHVHRAGVSTAAAAPPPVAAAATSAGAQAPPAAAVPVEMLAAATAIDTMQPTDLPEEPFYTALPSDAIAADGAAVDAYLPNSAIPATSGGLPLMPQPLMPYQELDSDSAPTSYNVSIAGSAAAWSRGPSPRPTVVLAIDSATLEAARRVSSVVAVSTAELRPPSLGVSDSAAAPPPTDLASTAAETAEVRAGGYDLSHLIDDDESMLSADPSSMFQRTPVGEGSDRPSTLKTTSSTLGGSHSHVPALPEAPHESALRYNPVYDPLGSSSSLGGAAPGGPFGAAADAATGALSGNFSDGGSFGGCMNSLQHETAYTPLAQATGDNSDGSDGALATALHARLRSAGGTSTAVLVPNPTYDDPAEYDRHSPVAAISADAPAVAAAPGSASTASQGVDAAKAPGDTFSAGAAGETAAPYPRLQLQFSDASSGGPVETRAASGSSGPSAGAALPLSPVDVLPSPAMASMPAPQGASGTGAGAAATAAGNPRISSGRISEVLLAADAAESGANSADLSSLLANSLTESQLNMLAVAPELPTSRPHSWLQHPQMELSTGGASAVARAAGAAMISSDGTPADVTMSLDFEEISREAAALADTLSLQISGEAAEALKAYATGTTAIGPAAADAAASANSARTAPMMAAAVTVGADGAAKEPPIALTSGHKRHAMGDMVAAAVRRFELGAASAEMEAATPFAVAPVAGVYADAHVVAECPAPAQSASKLPRCSSSGIPRGPPSPSASGLPAGGPMVATAPSAAAPVTPAGTAPHAIDFAASALVSMGGLAGTAAGAGTSSDWQSVALSTSSSAGLPRQVTGASSASLGLGVEAGAKTLAPLGSGVESAASETSATVFTREWVPTMASQEIPVEAAEPGEGGDEQPPDAPLQEQESGSPAEPGAATPATAKNVAKPAGRSGGGSPAAAAASRAANSPARRPGNGILGSGRTPSSPGGNTTATPASAAGRQQPSRTPASVTAARTASARPSSPAQTRAASGAGAGAGSSGSAARAAPTSSSGAARRATQSPLRTTPVSRTVRASAPGGRMAGSTTATPQPSQVGGESKPAFRTGRRVGG